MFPADTNIRSDPSIDKTILGKYLIVQCVIIRIIMSLQS
jgi:hypothetical protein